MLWATDERGVDRCQRRRDACLDVFELFEQTSHRNRNSLAVQLVFHHEQGVLESSALLTQRRVVLLQQVDAVFGLLVALFGFIARLSNGDIVAFAFRAVLVGVLVLHGRVPPTYVLTTGRVVAGRRRQAVAVRRRAEVVELTGSRRADAAERARRSDARIRRRGAPRPHLS